MKILPAIKLNPVRQEAGSAVLVVLVLLTIILVFASANTATLKWLNRQVSLIDQSESRYLNSSVTNRPSSK